MVGLYYPPKRAVRRDACQHGVPRLFSEPTRSLKVRIDACCGVAPERSVRSNQRVDLGGRQLDTLIAQRRQSADRITQEFHTVFLVGHQATDDHLNGSQRHDCASGGRAAPTCVRPMSLRTRRSKRRSSTTSTSLAEAQPLSPARLVVPSLANNAPRNGSKSAGARLSTAPIWLVGAPCASGRRASRSEGVIRKTEPLSIRRPASGADSDGANFRM